MAPLLLLLLLPLYPRTCVSPASLALVTRSVNHLSILAELDIKMRYITRESLETIE